MEFFEDCHEISLRKADVRLAESLGRALERIHRAMVVHRDIEERNILLVRESGEVRVVWIDFSSAWCGLAFEKRTAMEWNLFRNFLYGHLVEAACTHLMI
jgi:tRNA A-37 threonylcarbamoyl transferase component Bud32